jgi:hypothetical protein
VKKLDKLAHLLANPVLPKASRHWSGVGVFIASAPQPDHLRRSFYARDPEVLTEHALEVSYFFEVLRDSFDEVALIDHRSKSSKSSKIELFRRLTAPFDYDLGGPSLIFVSSCSRKKQSRGICPSFSSRRRTFSREGRKAPILENDRFRENHHKCDPTHRLSNLRFSKTFLETLFSIDHTYDEF